MATFLLWVLGYMVAAGIFCSIFTAWMMTSAKNAKNPQAKDDTVCGSCLLGAIAGMLWPVALGMLIMAYVRKIISLFKRSR